MATQLGIDQAKTQAFVGAPVCHPERSEGSGSPDAEILRCAQDDRQNRSQVRSRDLLSPNVWGAVIAGDELKPI